VSTALKNTVTADGVADIMDFHLIPFGNAYFVTTECKGAGGYDSKARQCFSKQCGAGAGEARPSDCFTGPIVCQHGTEECNVNRLFTCAVKTSSQNSAKYIPFVECMEAKYERISGKELDAAKICATTAGLPFDAISKCYAPGSDGDLYTVQDAMATPEHPGVPWVLLNGKSMDDPMALLKSVCAAYTGEKPKGCGATYSSQTNIDWSNQLAKDAALTSINQAQGSLIIVM